MVSDLSTETMTPRVRGILKALPDCGFAFANSASAACTNTSSVGGDPSKTSSALYARQGRCATPPMAIRAPATIPFSEFDLSGNRNQSESEGGAIACLDVRRQRRRCRHGQLHCNDQLVGFQNCVMFR